MVDRPHGGEGAVLVHVHRAGCYEPEHEAEFRELALAAAAHCLEPLALSIRRPDAGLMIGRGQVAQVAEAVKRHEAALVIFDIDLSPSQERNLERELQCRVLSRSGLILDIFARRARSHEGKLQVELAQLRHLSTRLVRGWSHLERQKGGIGLRGPGETQLETDRRLLAGRISQISRRLDRIVRHRDQNRKARSKASVATMSLVGYTNAGKSTLFNALTTAEVLSADQLFATLDPTLRRIDLGGGEQSVLVDTVGFVRRLPHELIAAFAATLEETRQASLLLHVIDAGDETRDEHMEQVRSVLAQIDADDIPCIEVYNKIDLIGQTPRLERDGAGRAHRVWLSAATGAGLDLLHCSMREHMVEDAVHTWVCLPPEATRQRACLFNLGAVVSEVLNPTGEWLIEVQTSRRKLRQLCHREGLRKEWLQHAID